MKSTNYLLGIFTLSWSLATSATSFNHHGRTDEIVVKETKTDASMYPVVNEKSIGPKINMNHTGKFVPLIFVEE